MQQAYKWDGEKSSCLERAHLQCFFNRSKQKPSSLHGRWSVCCVKASVHKTLVSVKISHRREEDSVLTCCRQLVETNLTHWGTDLQLLSQTHASLLHTLTNSPVSKLLHHNLHVWACVCYFNQNTNTHTHGLLSCWLWKPGPEGTQETWLSSTCLAVQRSAHIQSGPMPLSR